MEIFQKENQTNLGICINLISVSNWVNRLEFRAVFLIL